MVDKPNGEEIRRGIMPETILELYGEPKQLPKRDDPQEIYIWWEVKVLDEENGEGWVALGGLNADGLNEVVPCE